MQWSGSRSKLRGSVRAAKLQATTMIYAEAAYFDGAAVAHVVAWEEHRRLLARAAACSAASHPHERSKRKQVSVDEQRREPVTAIAEPAPAGMRTLRLVR
ncbi:hypothetical protein NOVOSPHI9U_710006 [Novosphingobium sp. 9U]|nr:hypothetical protein NOVOSPHI9U_710006 [Novosphingobium sp. 9U]